MSGVFLALGLVIGVALGLWIQQWPLAPGQSQRQGRAKSQPPPGAMSQTGSSNGNPNPAPAEQASAAADSGSTRPDPGLYLAYLLAREQAQFRGGFLARTAHELRSPLSSLMGLLQLILADLCDDPAEERQCVGQAYEAAQNLNQLMDQLIRVSKLEQGSQRLDPQPMDLSVLLEEVQSLVRLQVADRNARLTLELPPQAVYAKLDYNSIRQMLVMLIEAAVTDGATTIRLGLPRPEPGEAVRLYLADDRPAIAWQEAMTVLNPSPTASPAELPDQLQAQLQTHLPPTTVPDQPFVPHRLSPGLALLASRLILAMNQGSLMALSSAKDGGDQSAEPAGTATLGATLVLSFPRS